MALGNDLDTTSIEPTVVEGRPHLKERRRLILVPREMPYSALHLENMLKLARIGVVIMPPNPGFYHRPKTVQDLVDFVVARILDHLNIPHELVPRWGSDAHE